MITPENSHWLLAGSILGTVVMAFVLAWGFWPMRKRIHFHKLVTFERPDSQAESSDGPSRGFGVVGEGVKPSSAETLSQEHGVHIRNSHSTGKVTASEGSSNVGGLIGGIHTGRQENSITPDERLRAAWMSAALNHDTPDLRNCIYINHYDIDLRHLIDDDSYFEVTYQLRSSSVYTIDIGAEVKGHSFYDKSELEKVPEVRKPVERLERGEHDKLVLRQWVSPSVMRRVQLDEGKDIEFHFKDVDVLVNARYPDGTQGPQCRLNIPSHIVKTIPSKSDLENQ